MRLAPMMRVRPSTLPRCQILHFLKDCRCVLVKTLLFLISARKRIVIILLCIRWKENATLMVDKLKHGSKRRVSGSVTRHEITCFQFRLGYRSLFWFLFSKSMSCMSFLYIKSIIVVSIVPKTSSLCLVFLPVHFCPSSSTNTVEIQQG